MIGLTIGVDKVVIICVEWRAGELKGVDVVLANHMTVFVLALLVELSSGWVDGRFSLARRVGG